MQDPQERLLNAMIDKKVYSEKIVNHDVDLKRWKIKSLYKDSLWLKMLDDPDADLIKTGNLYVKPSSTKGKYRIGEVILAGPDVVHAHAGQRVILPNAVGQDAHRTYEGHKTMFVREDAIMAVIEFEGTEQEMSNDIEDQLLLAI